MRARAPDRKRTSEGLANAACLGPARKPALAYHHLKSTALWRAPVDGPQRGFVSTPGLICVYTSSARVCAWPLPASRGILHERRLCPWRPVCPDAVLALDPLPPHKPRVRIDRHVIQLLKLLLRNAILLPRLVINCQLLHDVNRHRHDGLLWLLCLAHRRGRRSVSRGILLRRGRRELLRASFDHVALIGAAAQLARAYIITCGAREVRGLTASRDAARMVSAVPIHASGRRLLGYRRM